MNVYDEFQEHCYCRQNPISSILGGFLQSLQSVILDMWNARSPVMVIGIAGSMVLGLLWVILVRFFVGCIVWTTIVLVLVTLFFFGVWSYLHSGIFDTTALTTALANTLSSLDSAVSFVNLTNYGVSQTTFNFSSAVGANVAVDLGIFNFNISATLLYTISAITCTVLFVAVLVGICIFCKKIRIAIAIIQEASKAIQQMPGLVLCPFVTAAFTLIFFVMFVSMGAFIYSLEYVTIGTIVSDLQTGLAKTVNVNCTQVYTDADAAHLTALQNNITEIKRLQALGTNMSDTPFANIDVSALIADGKKFLLQDAPDYAVESLCSGLSKLEQFGSYQLDTAMLFIHLFGWLWTNQIMAAIGICVITGAVSDWYFTRPSGDPSRKGGDGKSFQWPILRSVSRTFRFHLGSLIFGAAIIAIVQLIRAVMAWLDEKTKDWQNKNSCYKNMFKVIHCILWCFEECIKYITVNAYIMIAMRGFSFCDSCCRGVKLLFANMAQFMLVACFSKVIIFLGKFVIVAVCVSSLYFWLTFDPFFSASKCDQSIIGCDSFTQKIYGGAVSNHFFPVLLGGFVSYLCARSFLFVYDMTIKTILLCFCEDCRVHQIEESTELAKELHKEAYMSQNLRRIMLPSKEYGAMKAPMTLEEVMALDPANKDDPTHAMDRLLDCKEIVELTTTILSNSDEALHDEIDLDKLNGNEALLKAAGGQELWDAYKEVEDKEKEGIKYVDVVSMIKDHLGEQGLLQKWSNPLTQEQIDSHFNDTGVVTAEEVKSVQHGRFDSKFAQERKSQMLSFQSIHDIGRGDAKLQPKLNKPRESGSPTE